MGWFKEWKIGMGKKEETPAPVRPMRPVPVPSSKGVTYRLTDTAVISGETYSAGDLKRMKYSELQRLLTEKHYEIEVDLQEKIDGCQRKLAETAEKITEAKINGNERRAKQFADAAARYEMQVNDLQDQLYMYNGIRNSLPEATAETDQTDLVYLIALESAMQTPQLPLNRKRAVEEKYGALLAKVDRERNIQAKRGPAYVTSSQEIAALSDKYLQNAETKAQNIRAARNRGATAAQRASQAQGAVGLPVLQPVASGFPDGGG